MWMVAEVAFRAHELDFSSSGGKSHPTTSVLADGVEIINALELVEQDADPLAVWICDQCGTPGCNSGNRVSIRTFDDGLVMIPAFAAMVRDTWSRDENGAPYFTRRNGIPLFRGAALRALRSQMARLGDLDQHPPLSL